MKIEQQLKGTVFRDFRPLFDLVKNLTWSPYEQAKFCNLSTVHVNVGIKKIKTNSESKKKIKLNHGANFACPRSSS